MFITKKVLYLYNNLNIKEMELTKEFCQGFCEAALANEIVHGCGEGVSVQVVDQNGKFYASLIGCTGSDHYNPGDYYNAPEGGDPTYGEIEKIELSGTWIDCKKDTAKFWDKLQNYFSEVCDANFRTLQLVS